MGSTKTRHLGIYHHLSGKHLERYINEFAGRLNMRHCHTIDQMRHIAQHMAGKQLTYTQLTT